MYRTLAHLFEMSRNGVTYTPVDAEGIRHGVSAATWARPLWTLCEAAAAHSSGSLNGDADEAASSSAASTTSSQAGAAAARHPAATPPAQQQGEEEDEDDGTVVMALKAAEGEGLEGAADAPVAVGTPPAATATVTAVTSRASKLHLGGGGKARDLAAAARAPGDGDGDGGEGRASVAVRLLRSAPMWCYLYSHEPLKSKKTPPKTSAHMVDMYRCASPCLLCSSPVVPRCMR